MRLYDEWSRIYPTLSISLAACSVWLKPNQARRRLGFMPEKSSRIELRAALSQEFTDDRRSYCVGADGGDESGTLSSQRVADLNLVLAAVTPEFEVAAPRFRAAKLKTSWWDTNVKGKNNLAAAPFIYLPPHRKQYSCRIPSVSPSLCIVQSWCIFDRVGFSYSKEQQEANCRLISPSI